MKQTSFASLAFTEKKKQTRTWVKMQKDKLLRDSLTTVCPVEFCVRKINFISILGAILMFNNINSPCHAEDMQEIALPVRAFKGHAVFIWKEKSLYQFAWLLDTNALIQRRYIAKTTPVFESAVEANMNKMKGLNQFMRIYFVENPHSPTFIDDNHDPMQPREEFSDLVDRLSDLAKKNEINIFFIDSHNNKKGPGGF
jgi:hypothetical protein